MSRSLSPAELDQMSCYGCQKDLRPVGGATTSGCEQWDNALVIEISGGYGMFVDLFAGRPDPAPKGQLEEGRVVICHECAHELCVKVPFFERLINPQASHAHTHDRDWKGHEGWDLPHDCQYCGNKMVFGVDDEERICPSKTCHELRGLPEIDIGEVAS